MLEIRIRRGWGLAGMLCKDKRQRRNAYFPFHNSFVFVAKKSRFLGAVTAVDCSLCSVYVCLYVCVICAPLMDVHLYRVFLLRDINDALSDILFLLHFLWLVKIHVDFNKSHQIGYGPTQFNGTHLNSTQS